MNILLVRPHPSLLVVRRLQESFLLLEPLDLEIVAGGVPRADNVEILDLSLEKKPYAVFKDKLRRGPFDLIGFTGYSTNVGEVKALARMAKEHNENIVTIVGGIHATLLPCDYAVAHIDIIVRGEGGTVIPEIIRRFKAKERLYFDDKVLSPSDVQFSEKCTSEPPPYPAVETIPRPRRDLVDRSRYFSVWTSATNGKLDTMFPRVASLRTSVGCAFSCSFCVIPFVMHGKYVQRTPEDVVDEITGLNEEYIYFVDDEMFLNSARVRRIAELLKAKGVKKQYVSWARSDTIVKNPDIFRLWKEVGLTTVFVGLESMDETRLDEYKKRTDIETNKKAIALLKEIGIMLHASFIVHPDFTVEEFRRLEKNIVDVSPAEITFTVLAPSPGTPFWQQHKDSFICDPYRYYDCMHTVLPTRLPLKRFYQHFARLTHLALRRNPLRMNRTKVPFRDLVRAIVSGTRYIFSLYALYRDYKPEVRS